MWAMIATWRMALEGVTHASKMLSENEKVDDAIEQAIKMVEDYPYYKSVGFGGLPNEDMEVELDAGFMNGTSKICFYMFYIVKNGLKSLNSTVKNTVF